MKIYKFKSLEDVSAFHHLLQIIDENKVWCSKPDSLNDKSEFNFELDYRPTNVTAVLLMKLFVRHGTLNMPPNVKASYALLNNKLEEVTKPVVIDMVKKCRNTIGITSFSLVGTGSWLWKEYGGFGNGAVVEFELPNSSLGSAFHTVEYVEKNIFHIDDFLESALGDSSQLFKRILCTKTKHWNDEQEIRFLGNTPNVNVVFEAPATTLTIGKNVSESLRKKLIDHCETSKIRVGHQE